MCVFFRSTLPPLLFSIISVKKQKKKNLYLINKYVGEEEKNNFESEEKKTYIIVIGRITNYCEKINYKIFKDVCKQRRWVKGWRTEQKLSLWLNDAKTVSHLATWKFFHFQSFQSSIVEYSRNFYFPPPSDARRC